MQDMQNFLQNLIDSAVSDDSNKLQQSHLSLQQHVAKVQREQEQKKQDSIENSLILTNYIKPILNDVENLTKRKISELDYEIKFKDTNFNSDSEDEAYSPVNADITIYKFLQEHAGKAVNVKAKGIIEGILKAIDDYVKCGEYFQNKNSSPSQSSSKRQVTNQTTPHGAAKQIVFASGKPSDTSKQGTLDSEKTKLIDDDEQQTEKNDNCCIPGCTLF